MTMTSSDVAREIGTDAKTLRRFLRADPSYRNVGSGGRYDFQPSDIPTVKKLFTAWIDGKKVSIKPSGKTSVKTVDATPRTRAEIDADVWAEEDAQRAAAGLGPVVVPPMTPTLRQAAAERVARLEARLRERGRHVSQVDGVDDWRNDARPGRGAYNREVAV
jgi:hypothetical protein